ALKNLSDYSTVSNIIEPLFNMRTGALREIQVAAGPETPFGSILATPKLKSDGGGLLLRSDRNDCERIEGQHGCVPGSLGADTSEWYIEAFGVGKMWNYVPPKAVWSGPNFVRNSPFEAVCEELCWEPSFTFVARAERSGGPKAVVSGLPPAYGSNNASSVLYQLTGFPMLETVLVRSVISAGVMQEVVKKAEMLSQGQAILCTSNGDVIAAADMADGVKVIEDSGNIRVAKVWEASPSWASAATKDLVSNAAVGVSVLAGEYTVTARKLEGPSGDAMNIGPSLRLVLATPLISFMDPLLYQLQPVSIAASATLPAVMVIAMVAALLMKGRIGRLVQKGKQAIPTPSTARIKQGMRFGRGDNKNLDLDRDGNAVIVTGSKTRVWSRFNKLRPRFKSQKSLMISDPRPESMRVSTAMEWNIKDQDS
ncbi:unnamed protein product, partial [Polarella glacialis]